MRQGIIRAFRWQSTSDKETNNNSPGRFFLHHWWCVPCNFGGCDCHASFGANNASTDEPQLDILEQQENVGRWPLWATLKWIQHSFCQLMIWKFNSTCNMSGHLRLVNLNTCQVHSSSIEIYIMLWMFDQHILHSRSSSSAILVVGRLSWILSWIPSTCRWRSGELMEVSGDKVWGLSAIQQALESVGTSWNDTCIVLNSYIIAIYCKLETWLLVCAVRFACVV